MKVNLTIIIIQRITRAFDRTVDCAFDKSNICGSHANAGMLERLTPDVTVEGVREGGKWRGRD